MKPLFLILLSLFGNVSSDDIDYHYEKEFIYRFSEDLCSKNLNHFNFSIGGYLRKAITLNKGKLLNNSDKVEVFCDVNKETIYFEIPNAYSILTFPDSFNEKIKIRFENIQLGSSQLSMNIVVDGCYNPSTKLFHRRETPPDCKKIPEGYKANFSNLYYNVIDILTEYLKCMEDQSKNKFCKN